MQRIDITKLQSIHEHTKERITNKKLVGASTLVAQNGKIIWSEQQGYSDYENNVRILPNAMFRLASMTKIITAVAVLKLIETGKLNLYDEVWKFIPNFKEMNVGKIDANGKIISVVPAQNKIRILDLLTHSSGLGQGALGDIEFRKIFPKEGDRISDIVPLFGDMLLDFEPRTCTGYSPLLAFDTLEYIIEKISDMDYEDYLKKYIFNPLDIKDITFTPSAKQQSRLVNMYTITENGFEYFETNGNNFQDLPNSYTSAGASLLGSIEDYYKFGAMLCNNGKFEGGNIIKESSVKLLGTPMLADNLPGLWNGLNWGLAARVVTKPEGDGAPLPVGSYGWSGAFGTHFWIDPTNNILGLYCTNLSNGGGSGADTAREMEIDVMKSL